MSTFSTTPCAAFDLDGTLLEHNSSFSFCRFLRQRGVLSRSDLLYCATLYSAHLFFGFSLHKLHTNAFNRLFRGRTVESLRPHVAPFLEEVRWYQPALERLNALRSSGYTPYILSNSPAFLVEPLAAAIGIEHVFATDYTIDNQGRLWDIATLVDGEKKRQILHTLGSETIAFSDSHHDLPFLKGAATAVAVRPTRQLLRIARDQKWEVL